MTTMHSGVDVRGVMALIRERGNPGIVEADGRILSAPEALDWLQELLDKGIKTTSGCPTPLKDGRCPGHNKAVTRAQQLVQPRGDA